MSTAISVRDLGKQYQRPPRAAHRNSLRDAFSHGLKSLLDGSGIGRGDHEAFWALRDVNFDIAKGESVGIIGLNGAGKSTLLKLLSRITAPTTGHARIVGRLGALLEVGTGFHRELTGRENIFLYGSIIGMDRAEIARKFEAIVNFAEIGEFIEMPVKRYSSGMYVRLAFSVAAHLEPDILLLDEVLAVGDYAFQKKCLDHAQRLERKGSTILLVSHNMFSIKTMCERVIYIRKGQLAFDGPTDEGLRFYEKDSYLADPHWFRPSAGTRPIEVRDVELTDESGRAKSLYNVGDRMRIRFRYATNEPVEAPNVLVSMTRSDDVLCCNFSSLTDGIHLPTLDGEGNIEVLTPPLKLVSDIYSVEVTIQQRGFEHILCAQLGGRFHVQHPVFDSSVFGVFNEQGAWRIESRQETIQ